jgi:Sigma-70, region 4
LRRSARVLTPRDLARDIDNPAILKLVGRIDELPFDIWWGRLLQFDSQSPVADGLAEIIAKADSLEIQQGRGREGWLARWRMSELLGMNEQPADERHQNKEAHGVERILHRVAGALVVRDLISTDEFELLYSPMSSLIAASDLESDPLESLLRRCPHPLNSLLLWAQETIPEPGLNVLMARVDRTLEEIGRSLGLTRERIRQIEERSARLCGVILSDRAPELREAWLRMMSLSFASSEDVLLSPYFDQAGDVDAQRRLGRALLERLGAKPPSPFQEWRVNGWWTLEPERMVQVARELASLLPCSIADLDDALGQFPVFEADALRSLMNRGGAGFRFHPAAGVWVRTRAQDRDAALLILEDFGEPCDIDTLADRIGLRRAALAEALRRDERFVQLRPTGLWALSGWGIEESPYSTVFEAAHDVIDQLGPLTIADLFTEVRRRYPVSDGAIQQCLNHRTIGRWPDGRVDLVSRGAPPIARREPQQPADVDVSSDGSVSLYQDVDADVLRGSGLGVSPYVTWALGLRVAPSHRTFDVGRVGTLRVRYAIQGSSISSLRSFAELLGASQGCRLQVTLDPNSDAAAVALACRGHQHAGSVP